MDGKIDTNRQMDGEINTHRCLDGEINTNRRMDGEINTNRRIDGQTDTDRQISRCVPNTCTVDVIWTVTPPSMAHTARRCGQMRTHAG